MTGEKMYRKLVLILILCISTLLYAGDGKAGQAGSVMRYGASAKSLAMGSSVSTISDGGDALIFNAAGLGMLERWQFDFMHSQLWLDTRVNYAAFTIPVKNVGGFGVGFLNMGVNKIDGRDEYNQPTGEFSHSESVIMLGYGKWFMSKMFRAGLVAKFNMYSQDDQSASGLGGFDVGIVSKSLLSRKLRLGLNLQNLGAGEIAGDAAPITVRGGASYKMTRKLMFSAEALLVAGGDVKPQVGAEYKISKTFAIRAGYNGNEVTFGLGIALDRLVGGQVLGTYPTLDYAGSAMNNIDNNFMRFSLTLKGEEMTPFWELVDKLLADGNLCENQSEIETFIEKDGAVGSMANVLVGGCLFNFESVEAPLAAEPKLKDVNEFFRMAYIDIYGSDWATIIVTNEELKAHNVFHQKTHYMFAETEMANEITTETKELINQLILTGGDSTQYDSRLQYDLAYTHEVLGNADSAIELYKAIAKRDIERPEKYLAQFRLGELLREEDKETALGYLSEITENFSYGFYDEDGMRESYPMYPKKYKDNTIVDEALLIMGDIFFTQEKTEEALSKYLDIVLFYPDLNKSVVKEAREKAAKCYEKLGNTEAASALRAGAGV